MTTKNTNILTNGQNAGQLNAERISDEVLYDRLYHPQTGIHEVENMLTAAATENYLDGLDKDNLPAPEEAAHGLFQKTVDTFRKYNERLPKSSEPVPMPEELTTYQVAKLMMALYHIRLVTGWDDSPDYEVMLYVDGENYIYELGGEIGTYTRDFWHLVAILSSCSEEYISFKRIASEVEFWLRIFAKKVTFSYFQGFLPLFNGVFNCRTEEFLPFSPEYVFDECTYGGLYVEGEDGPTILSVTSIKSTKVSVDDWIKSDTANKYCEELSRILPECV